MAISDIYNSLTFGGVNSLDYGIYISGPGVFNAPTRAVTFVDVPGRNGAIEIDEGHWNNIEVRYTAGTFGDDQSDFASKINAFRNAIVSQIGYQRITDTYNPEEYRLGIYASGLSVNPENRNEAGEFELVFSCKPQRYLIDGETPISVSSGDTIMNPTLYDAGPLLTVEGTGLISLGNENIVVNDISIGDVILLLEYSSRLFDAETTEQKVQLNNMDQLNPRDKVEMIGIRATETISLLPTVSGTITSVILSGPSDFTDFIYTYDATRRTVTVQAHLNGNVGPFEISSGPVDVGWFNLLVEFSNSIDVTTVVCLFEAEIDEHGELTIRQGGEVLPSDYFTAQQRIEIFEVVGDSTKSALGHPTYIDCEVGDAYAIENGTNRNINKAVVFGSNLPKLKPGNNSVTLDNTITDLEIMPRWWEL